MLLRGTISPAFGHSAGGILVLDSKFLRLMNMGGKLLASGAASLSSNSLQVGLNLLPLSS